MGDPGSWWLNGDGEAVGMLIGGKSTYALLLLSFLAEFTNHFQSNGLTVPRCLLWKR